MVHGLLDFVGKVTGRSQRVPHREDGKLRGPCSIAQQSLVFRGDVQPPHMHRLVQVAHSSGCSSVAAAG